MTQRKKEALINSTTDTLKRNHRLRDRTDRAWFIRLLRHPARRRSHGRSQSGQSHPNPF